MRRSKVLVPAYLIASFLWASLAALPWPATAQTTSQEQAAPYSVAVIGDQPYGSFFESTTTRLLQTIDDDPAVMMVLHTGDIKGGGESCDDELLKSRIDQMNQSPKPLIYAIGDNEWTDCHRTSNGSYDPQERLQFLRDYAFENPSTSLGQDPISVSHQGEEGYPEHQMFRVASTLFVVLNVPGSNNNLSAPSSRKDSPENIKAQFETRHQAINRWLVRAIDYIKEHSMTEWVVLI
ncbi:MAG: metallophosphoesterase, partial [Limnobacter sp.]|nr:metallophosphoesterase [Limnobacter sp.]